jgi:hypothetical protein
VAPAKTLITGRLAPFRYDTILLTKSVDSPYFIKPTSKSTVHDYPLAVRSRSGIPMHLLRRLFIALSLAAVSIGCEQSIKNQPSSPPISSKDRPPLRILIVDAPELEKELLIRWQVSFDQPIRIENVTTQGMAERTDLGFDAIIYPSKLIGDLIQRDAIGRLPTQVLAKSIETMENKESQSATNLNSNSVPLDLSQEWTNRLRTSVTYGGKIYGVPLGANQLTLICKNADTTALNELSLGLSSNSISTSTSIEYWDRFLKPIESTIGSPLQDGQAATARRLASLNVQEEAYLVDRFLWLTSTTDARRTGLFDLTNMKARLKTPDFTEAAKILARLAVIDIEVLLTSPVQAWSEPLRDNSTKPRIAIGWPDTKTTESSDATLVQTSVQVANLAWNANQGLVGSIGKATRQTAVSVQFLRWVSEPEQREFYRNVCSRIELLPAQQDRNLARDDYRDYQSVNSKASRFDGLGLSLRMANAEQYRSLLAKALVAGLSTPGRMEAVMADCSLQWEELTDKLGREKQRISEENSQGF